MKFKCSEYRRFNIRQVGDSDILRSISMQLLPFAFALKFKAVHANFSRKARKDPLPQKKIKSVAVSHFFCEGFRPQN